MKIHTDQIPKGILYTRTYGIGGISRNRSDGTGLILGHVNVLNNKKYRFKSLQGKVQMRLTE